MTDVWLVQIIDDDREASITDVGIAKTRKKGIEMLHAYLATKGMKAIIPLDDSSIIVREKSRAWSDEAEDMVWDGETWHDWGYGFVSRFTVGLYEWEQSE